MRPFFFQGYKPETAFRSGQGIFFIPNVFCRQKCIFTISLPEDKSQVMNTAPSRLFDLVQYQSEHYPQEDMLAGKVSAGSSGAHGEWKKYSTAEVERLSICLTAGLLKLGLGGKELDPLQQDKVAILSGNCPEWVITDLACQQAGIVSVPVYPTISEAELLFILQDAEVKVVFAGDDKLWEKVQAVRSQVPSIRHIFTFHVVEGAAHWQELLDETPEEKLSGIDLIKQRIQPGCLATIIYTSGTTGYPKGVMLSHHNIVSNVLTCMDYLPVFQTDRALSFLPLNHIFERMITYLYITAGVSIYYAESMETVAENLREVGPHIFTTVPRLLEKVYEKIMAKGMELKGIKRKPFFWAIDIGRRFEINRKTGIAYRLQLRLARRLVFSKWRAALGGNVRAIVTGSAACQVRLLRLFTAAGIPVLEGYGLTETSPAISVNRMDEKDRMFGTVGPVIKGVEVKIAADGEILCKGPNIAQGYFKRPDLTAEAFVDGWFHTGDIGELVQGKFLKITDRKKELFKTSGGKYVAPQPIENKMKESPYIEQIMVIGADRKFTAALIVPSFSNLRDWCVHHHVPDDAMPVLLRNPAVQSLYHDIVERFNKEFNHVEQVKKFELLPTEWSIEGGELTPTLKLKRKNILEKYRDLVEKIYDGKAESLA